mgnify:CR=1 FL=1
MTKKKSYKVVKQNIAIIQYCMIVLHCIIILYYTIYIIHNILYIFHCKGRFLQSCAKKWRFSKNSPSSRNGQWFLIRDARNASHFWIINGHFANNMLALNSQFAIYPEAIKWPFYSTARCRSSRLLFRGNISKICKTCPTTVDEAQGCHQSCFVRRNRRENY